MTRIAFISGPISPPPHYFTKHYSSRILDGIASGDTFVIGPAPGVDTLALHFLLEHNVPASRITVYLAEFQQHNMPGRDSLKWFEDLGGNIKVEAVTTGQRDAAMTRDSDYDILRYMTEREEREIYGETWYRRVSNTEKNERRRKGLKIRDYEVKEEQEQEDGGEKKEGLRGRWGRACKNVLGMTKKA